MAIPIGDSEDQKFKGLFSQTNLNRGIHIYVFSSCDTQVGFLLQLAWHGGWPSWNWGEQLRSGSFGGDLWANSDRPQQSRVWSLLRRPHLSSDQMWPGRPREKRMEFAVDDDVPLYLNICLGKNNWKSYQLVKACESPISSGYIIRLHHNTS